RARRISRRHDRPSRRALGDLPRLRGKPVRARSALALAAADPRLPWVAVATVRQLDPAAVAAVGAELKENIGRALKVRDDVVRALLAALLAEGHVLIEDFPGVGKTALARALARSLDAAYSRVQCTADLLPADVIGTNVFNQQETRFEFHPGPVF